MTELAPNEQDGADYPSEPRTTPIRLRRRPIPERLRLFADDLTGMVGHDDAFPGLIPVITGLRRAADELDTPILRDLIRAARINDLPLRRWRDGVPVWMRTWQVWDEAEHRRWIEVMQWPDNAGLGIDGETRWRIRISGYDTGTGYVHIELRDPSIKQLASALVLAGWDVRRRA